MHQLTDAAGMSSLKHRGHATDAQSSQIARVAGGLKPPREMHDHVCAIKHPTQISDGIVLSEVERAPISPLVDALLRRGPAHHSDDVVLGGEHAEQRGPYIATRSGDDDAHRCASRQVSPSGTSLPRAAASSNRRVGAGRSDIRAVKDATISSPTSIQSGVGPG